MEATRSNTRTHNHYAMREASAKDMARGNRFGSREEQSIAQHSEIGCSGVKSITESTRNQTSKVLWGIDREKIEIPCLYCHDTLEQCLE